MRARPLIGSPCDPVVITTMRSGGYSSTFSILTTVSGGIERCPSSPAKCTTLRIERPRNATLRPKRTAWSTVCWMRGTFEANDATTMRPFACEKIDVNASPTMRSESVWPGRSAFVESESMQSTPSSPTRAIRAKSAGLPSMGVWSNLKSPVWKTVPTGVRIASEHAPATEWLMWMNSASIEP